MATSKNVNQATEQFLLEYSKEDRTRDFAVMLKAPWGAGKTHFVKGFFERHKNSLPKTLYVSLYGLSTLQQIDEEIYRQLHPFLSSKKMRLLGRVGKGFLRGAFKIDLDGDSESDVTVSPDLKDSDLTDALGNPSNQILIFDDLERCSVPVDEVLGYINAFVEHEALKTIIIANEDEILRRSENPRYKETKEKVIGQTLEVRPDATAAISSFLAEVKGDAASKFLHSNLDEVLQIYSDSKTENLRSLKQALWDYERVAEKISSEKWANKEAMISVMRAIIALAIEHRAGRLHEEIQLEKLSNPFAFSGNLPVDEEELPFEQAVTQRYPYVNFAGAGLNYEFLGPAIFVGHVDEEALELSLSASTYFSKAGDTPLWLRAWYMWDQTDDVAEKITKELQEKFEKRAFVDEGEMFHVMGLLLWLADVGLIEMNRPAVKASCKEYIDDLLKQHGVGEKLKRRDIPITNGQTSGYAIRERQSQEFQEIERYYNEQYEKIAEAKYTNIAVEILKDFTNRLFELFVSSTSGEDNGRYADRPIFANVPPKQFVDWLTGLDPRQQGVVIQTFEKRHSSASEPNPLAEEKIWLRATVEEMEKASSKQQHMTKHRLEAFIGNLNKIIQQNANG